MSLTIPKAESQNTLETKYTEDEYQAAIKFVKEALALNMIYFLDGGLITYFLALKIMVGDLDRLPFLDSQEPGNLFSCISSHQGGDKFLADIEKTTKAAYTTIRHRALLASEPTLEGETRAQRFSRLLKQAATEISQKPTSDSPNPGELPSAQASILKYEQFYHTAELRCRQMNYGENSKPANQQRRAEAARSILDQIKDPNSEISGLWESAKAPRERAISSAAPLAKQSLAASSSPALTELKNKLSVMLGTDPNLFF